MTVLTNRAIRAAAIDPGAAAEELERAHSRLAVTEFDHAEKAKAVARARALIRIGGQG